MSRQLTVLLLSLILLEIGGGSAIVSAASDDRDHTVDWAVGGLQEGSRPLRPGAGGASAKPREKTSHAAVNASDTGGRTSRSVSVGARVTRERSVSGNRGIVSSGAAQPVRRGTGSTSSTTGIGTGSGSSKEGASETLSGGGGSIGGSGAVAEGTSGTTIEGGGAVESHVGAGATEPTPEASSGGTTSNDHLGIHVEADTSGGDVSGGVTVTGTDTDLSAGTEVTTGVDTGVETGGTVDATAEITDPATTVTSEATVADTGVSTELSGTTDVGDADLITDEANLTASDDCAGDPLHPCPTLP